VNGKYPRFECCWRRCGTWTRCGIMKHHDHLIKKRRCSRDLWHHSRHAMYIVNRYLNLWLLVCNGQCVWVALWHVKPFSLSDNYDDLTIESCYAQGCAHGAVHRRNVVVVRAAEGRKCQQSTIKPSLLNKLTTCGTWVLDKQRICPPHQPTDVRVGGDARHFDNRRKQQ
jgi:hypothetical protein